MRPCLFIVLLLVCCIAVSSAQAMDCEEPHTLTISELVDRAVRLAPERRADERRVAASELELEAFGLERRPSLQAWVDADAGRRARPGEERSMGPSARGVGAAELRWSAFEASRRARAEERAAAVTAARVRGQARVAQERAEVLRDVVEWTLRDAVVERLGEVEQEREADLLSLRLRADAGLESPEAVMAMREEGERIARVARVHAGRRDVLEERLAQLAGLCSPQPLLALRATPLEDVLEEWRRDGEGVPEGTTQGELLRAEANVLRATSDARMREGVLTWELYGRLAMHVSPAFDDVAEEEWVGGTLLTWRPDIWGMRSRRGAASTAEAGMVDALADAHESLLLRQLETIRSERVELTARMADEQAAQEELLAAEEPLRRRVEEGLAPPSSLRASRARERQWTIDRLEQELALATLDAEAALLLVLVHPGSTAP